MPRNCLSPTLVHVQEVVCRSQGRSRQVFSHEQAHAHQRAQKENKSSRAQECREVYRCTPDWLNFAGMLGALACSSYLGSSVRLGTTNWSNFAGVVVLWLAVPAWVSSANWSEGAAMCVDCHVDQVRVLDNVYAFKCVCILR